VHVEDDLPSASAALARHIARRARESVRARGRFTWVLSGGSTPQSLYRHLARRYRRTFPWAQTHVLFGDERCVAPDAPESNFGAAEEALLRHVPIPPRHVHRLHGEMGPLTKAAAEYARTIQRLSRSDAAAVPFDLVLLGIGPDGHTASLFPDDPALQERRRTVVLVRRPGQPPKVPRLTLTLPALAASREVCFLVAGREKAGIVARIFRTPLAGTAALPASLVQSEGPTLWFLDRAAASRIPASRLAPFP
jgi:6-phosphogluconolactonase